MVKRILVIVVIILIVIQFIHPSRNVTTGDQPNSIAKLYPVPEDVKAILVKGCNDCHSNNTRYPWYFRIQPIDWWLTHHINDGKEELNFDEFSDKPPRFQYHKVQAITDQIKKGEMPLDSYLWIHKDARLTTAEKNTLMDWANSIASELRSKYPPDSLSRKGPPGEEHEH